MRGLHIVALIAVSAGLLAGCARNDKVPSLMNISADGPDEFAILPNKPLEVPTDLAALPEPTPGGANRADPTPQADAVAALGGKPSRLQETGVPRSDGALVTQASRFGVATDIRATLAAEDLEFRRKSKGGRLLERWFNVNVYYKAYEDLSLDQHAELERWRGAGVRNVGAPPEEK